MPELTNRGQVAKWSGCAETSRFHPVRSLLPSPSLHTMSRITVTFTISLPPVMAEEIEVLQKKEHRTRSELIREALRQYIAAHSIFGAPK